MKNLFTSKGRLRRRDYFIITIIISLITFPLCMIIDYSNTFSIDFSIICIMILLLLPISILLCIRRFHDFEYSGWATLLLFVPIINIGGGFLLLFKDGTIGPNKYGDDPKGRQPKTIISDNFEK